MSNWVAPAFNRLADRWSPGSLEEIVEWMRPFVPAGGHLIDVGGGTGALAVKLARSLEADVTVLDPTPEMLRYVPEDPRVHPVLGNAEAMVFEDGSADAVLVSDAFHHFRDQPRAANEFSRVVRPGGGVIVLELDPRPWYMRIIVVGEKLLGEPGAFYTPEQMCAFFREHGIDGTCDVIRGASYKFTGTVR
ncbi:MAG: methyltransferase domain-containing protein [Coriobacteriia bacterium]|nr:methyltransferase domain-containing protein [Coriobacteriia bacterium]